jgi:hypothetical protein
MYLREMYAIVLNIQLLPLAEILIKFDTVALSQAISMIPRLRLFHWYYLYGSESPLVYDEVPSCLELLPSNLSDLSIPA